MSPLRAFAPLGYLLACAALLGAAPAASGLLYKWVDERGVTNYSNQPPVNPGAAKNLGPVGGNLSVYSPDPALLKAVASYRQDTYDRRLAERVDYLERQLAAEQMARQYTAAAMTPPPAPCVGDCYGGSYYPAGIGGGFFPVGHKNRHLIPSRLPVGATAGNTVGMGGFIPGQSALAASLAPPRPAQVRLGLEPGRAR